MLPCQEPEAQTQLCRHRDPRAWGHEPPGLTALPSVGLLTSQIPQVTLTYLILHLQVTHVSVTLDEGLIFVSRITKKVFLILMIHSKKDKRDPRGSCQPSCPTHYSGLA